MNFPDYQGNSYEESYCYQYQIENYHLEENKDTNEFETKEGVEANLHETEQIEEAVEVESLDEEEQSFEVWSDADLLLAWEETLKSYKEHHIITQRLVPEKDTRIEQRVDSCVDIKSKDLDPANSADFSIDSQELKKRKRNKDSSAKLQMGAIRGQVEPLSHCELYVERLNDTEHMHAKDTAFLSNIKKNRETEINSNGCNDFIETTATTSEYTKETTSLSCHKNETLDIMPAKDSTCNAETSTESGEIKKPKCTRQKSSSSTEARDLNDCVTSKKQLDTNLSAVANNTTLAADLDTFNAGFTTSKFPTPPTPQNDDELIKYLSTSWYYLGYYKGLYEGKLSKK